MSQTAGMAAPHILLRNARRLLIPGAALVAAYLVDAAFVDLEPGATVTFHLLWAMTTLALLGTIAAAHRRPPRGVHSFLDDLLARVRTGRRRTVRIRYA